MGAVPGPSRRLDRRKITRVEALAEEGAMGSSGRRLSDSVLPVGATGAWLRAIDLAVVGVVLAKLQGRTAIR